MLTIVIIVEAYRIHVHCTETTDYGVPEYGLGEETWAGQGQAVAQISAFTDGKSEHLSQRCV